MLASCRALLLGTAHRPSAAWPHHRPQQQQQQQQQRQPHHHRCRRRAPTTTATLATPTPTPTPRGHPRPRPRPRAAAPSSTAHSSPTDSFSPDASADESAHPPSPSPPLSARALELAAEAAAADVAAALLARGGRAGGGGGGGSGSSNNNGTGVGTTRPPPHYRFAAACISTDEEALLAVCPVEEMDEDEEDEDGRRAGKGGSSGDGSGDGSGSARAEASASPSFSMLLPASMSPLSSVHLESDHDHQPEQQQQPKQAPKQSQKQQRTPRQRALLQWAAGGPRRCLIVKKAGAAEPRRKMVEIVNWLADQGVACFVERAVHASELPGLPPFDPRSTAVDFAVTLGGDGTVLHLASMFEGGDTPLPPVVCFAMGTLGFLTAFSADDFEACLERVLAGDRHPLFCTLRSRTRVDVLMPVVQEGGGGEGSGGSNGDSPPEEEEEEEETGESPNSSSDNTTNGRRPRRRPLRPAVRLASTRHVLNECVVDRGAFPHAVYIEIFVDGTFVTAAEADGLIIATPSGSTAYSMSAGGPMVSPSVPCTLLTPLSPQSLSFRPLVIPGSSELLISLPRYARSHARLSIDGRSGSRLPRGSALRVTTSSCPLPFINLKPLDGDFYDAIVEKLRWNTLIRGRAGERPVPPTVLEPLAEEEEGEEEQQEELAAALPLSPASIPRPPPPSVARAA